MASDGERALRAAARVVPELASAAGGPDLRVEPLSGGVGRRTYRVWFDGDGGSFGVNSWAVRIAGGGVEGSLDLAGECEVGRAAAEAGLAPRVVGFDAAAGALVTEYLGDARALTPAHTQDGETIDRLAALLRSLHALDPRPRAFEPERFAASYLAALGGAGALAAADRGYAAELVRLARGYSAHHSNAVLCHNDLVASNILDDRGRLQLIDFEYAVSASPILDLAGLAALNGYSADERERLVGAYYAGGVPPFGPDDLERVVRLVRLIGYFWALAAARGAPDAERFREFAEQARASLS